MLSLPDVTLCTVFDRCHELHLLAADDCREHAEFGDVKLFSDDAVRHDVTQTKISSEADYKRFFHYEMPSVIETSHVLVIQWDSWIVNPAVWTSEFLKYDYVGAPWWYQDQYNVGNSGFCLMSRRLMKFLAEHESEFPVRQPFDATLCREYQRRLPQFRWAPSELAWHFAFERTSLYPINRVFGFHGLFNWPFVMSPDALRERLDLVSREPHLTSKPEWSEVHQIIKNFNIKI